MIEKASSLYALWLSMLALSAVSAIGGVVVAVGASADEWIATGSKLGGMTPSEILGVVAVASVGCNILLVWLMRKQFMFQSVASAKAAQLEDDRREKMLREVVGAMSGFTSALQELRVNCQTCWEKRLSR